MSALSIFRRMPSKSNDNSVVPSKPSGNYGKSAGNRPFVKSGDSFDRHLNPTATKALEQTLPTVAGLSADAKIGIDAPTVYMRLPDGSGRDGYEHKCDAANNVIIDAASKYLIDNSAAEKSAEEEAKGSAPDINKGTDFDSDAGRVHELPSSLILPNPNQPRKLFNDDATIRLADSIRQYGILQPLSVRRLSSDDSEQRYELIAGERRLRAAKLIGLETVPAIIIDVDNKTSAELAIIENLQRENLNVFEQAGAIASLIDVFKITQEEAARRLSTSQSYVANKLRLLRLTLPERDAIIKYGLTERHARALLKLELPEKRLEAIEYIASHSLNVAAAEDYVERLLCQPMISTDAKKNQHRLILKDIRLFYNTIDRALETVRSAGIEITSEKTETDGAVEMIIRIPNQYRENKSA